MHLSALWPRGMNILFNYGGQMLVNQTDKHGWLPITYALESRNHDAFQLLVEAGSALSSPDWNWHAEVLSRARDLDDRHLLDLAIDALKSRRVQLYDFAKESLPTKIWEHLDVSDDRVLDRDAKRVQKALEDFGIEIPTALLVRQKAATVYHTSPSLKVAHAESLYEAGFKDVDAIDDWGFTPLDTCCTFRPDLRDGLAFLVWLTSRGVDPCRQNRTLWTGEAFSGVSGYHMIGHFVGRAVASQFHRSNISGTSGRCGDM